MALQTWRGNQAKISWLTTYNAVSDKFNNLAVSLMKQLGEPVSAQRDAKFRRDFNRDFIDFSMVKKKLDDLHLEDAEDKYLRKRGKETVSLLYATIRDTSQIKGLPLPKDE